VIFSAGVRKLYEDRNMATKVDQGNGIVAVSDGGRSNGEPKISPKRGDVVGQAVSTAANVTKKGCWGSV